MMTMNDLTPAKVLSVFALLATLFSPSLTFGQETASDQPSSSAPATMKDMKDWITWTPSGAEVSFRVPERPRFVERQMTMGDNQQPIKIRMYLNSFQQNLGTLVFSYHDLKQNLRDQQQIDKNLDNAVAGSVANVVGQLERKPIPIKFKDIPGRQFVYQYQQIQTQEDGTEITRIYKVTSRIFLKGKRQYQITCLMDRDLFQKEIADHYLNSLQFLDVPQPTKDN
ncbi:MAG: hypothetical protein AAF623_00380 [Planctomycetota bacterium]